MMSNTLAWWLKEWNAHSDEQEERLITIRIQLEISGSDCSRCRPNILCQKCASRRGISPKQRKVHIALGHPNPPRMTEIH
jgi:hypothetical protein